MVHHEGDMGDRDRRQWLSDSFFFSSFFFSPSKRCCFGNVTNVTNRHEDRATILIEFRTTALFTSYKIKSTLKSETYQIVAGWLCEKNRIQHLSTMATGQPLPISMKSEENLSQIFCHWRHCFLDKKPKS